MKTAEDWYKDTLTKYIPPSVLEKGRAYDWLPAEKVKSLDVIKFLMKHYKILRAGYCATSVRGYHDHVVIYIEKSQE